MSGLLKQNSSESRSNVRVHYFAVVLPDSYGNIFSNVLLERCLSENHLKLVGNSAFLSMKIVHKYGMNAILMISYSPFDKEDVVSILMYMQVHVLRMADNLIEIHEELGQLRIKV
jgi:hypothetical protein